MYTVPRIATIAALLDSEVSANVTDVPALVNSATRAREAPTNVAAKAMVAIALSRFKLRSLVPAANASAEIALSLAKLTSANPAA